MKRFWISDIFRAALILIILGSSARSSAEDASIVKVNILFVYEDAWAEDLFNHSLKYIEQNQQELGVEIGAVYRFNASNESSLILSEGADALDFCTHLDDLLTSEDPPDIAIDFTRAGSISDAIKAMLKRVQLPAVSGVFDKDPEFWNGSNETSTHMYYQIKVAPPVQMLAMAVYSFCDLQEMESAAFLIDERYPKEEIYTLDLLHDLGTRNLPVHLEFHNLTGQIMRLVHLDMTNFFIASSPNAITEVLARASSPNITYAPYFDDEFAWYSMSMEEGIPRCVGCEKTLKLVHLSPEPTKDSKQKAFLQEQLGVTFLTFTQMFYFDIAVGAVRAVAQLKQADEWNHDISENSCVNWDSLHNITYPDIGLNLLDPFQKMTKDSILSYRINQAGRHYPEFSMKIQRLLYPNMTGAPNETEVIGIWRSGVGRKELIEFAKGKNLEGHKAMVVYRIVVVVQEPFVKRIADKSNCTHLGTKYENCFEGMALHILKIMQDELRFNYTIKEVTSGEEGFMSLEPPYEWNGMVREIVDKRADVALGAFSIMAERESVLDYTVPYYDLVGLSIMIQRYDTSTHLFRFMAPVDPEVWVSMVGMFFLTSTLMWIYDLFSPMSYRNNHANFRNAHPDEKRVFTFRECIWFCLTSITSQGGGEAPKNLSGRLAILCWWFFTFITIASYSASIAAHLTTPRLKPQVDSLEDLGKQFKIQYAPVVNSNAWYYFERMNFVEGILTGLWKDIILNNTDQYEQSRLEVWDYPLNQNFGRHWRAVLANNPPLTREIALERVKGKNLTHPDQEVAPFALVDDMTRIRWATKTNCNMRIVGEEFARKPYAIGVQKDSPLGEMFNTVIVDLLDTKKIDIIKAKWWYHDYRLLKCPRPILLIDGMSFWNIGGIFVVLWSLLLVVLVIRILKMFFWSRVNNMIEKWAPSSRQRRNTSATRWATEIRVTPATAADENGSFASRTRPNPFETADRGLSNFHRERLERIIN